MVRRDYIRNIKDCKVIPGEYVATQHRLVVMEMNVEMTRKPRPSIKQQKAKWWNLEKDEYKLNFFFTKGTINTGVCNTSHELLRNIS